MRKLLPFAFCFLPFALFAQKDYSALVNPFIGTGGHGHTYPGASMPFGMMQLSPDTRGADWDGSSGYHYSDSVIYGFSHTHLSGTGIPDYCDVLMMPFTGQPGGKVKNYSSTFSHKNEKASPGYYEVLLDRYQIKAQLTTSARSGMHQYTFPQGIGEGSILIDLKWRDELLESSLEKVSDYELRGMRRSKSWAQNQYVYFYIRFDKPIKSFAPEQKPAEGGVQTEANPRFSKKVQGPNMRAVVTFDLSAGHVIKAKVGISGVSTDGAKLNLDTEIKDWNFDKVRNDAKTAWNKELGKIEITGGTKDQQTVFYTALYHTSLVPNIYQDVDGQYRGTDSKIHKATGFTNYTVFSLWDTYRAYHPLMTIINQKRTTDWINTFLNQYKNGGMLPVWELSGNETFCMIGYHSVPVIVDAYQKGIREFDKNLALQAMRSYAESNRFGLDVYRNQGYVSNDKEHESVSKTLEYAYDDWCIAQFAKWQKQDSVYNAYIRRAQYYKNVFDPRTHHMRGKEQAMWHSPFDPREINNFFTEGNSWHYTFAVPQDITGLIKLHGSKEAFAAKLNELFTTSSQTTGRDQADVTGLIGQYAQGNEPSHHMVYLYNYAGMPWKTQELIHKICTEFYLNSPDGLIGNEDCGQMSAWFVLSSMGFYPVTPGSGEYVLGTPLFDEVRMNLENGKTFLISKKSKVKSKNAFYVSVANLNGKQYSKSYLLHSDLVKGGNLEFELSDVVNKEWGTKEDELPHSAITDNLIVPVPYFDVTTNKFRDSIQVSLGSIDNKEIYWAPIENEMTTPNIYTKPFYISQNRLMLAFGVENGMKSNYVFNEFHKLPSNRTISVLSKVHSMYTAGGPEALIDGVEGTTNWKAGEWQSYFDQDFEAIVDLQKEKPIKYAGVHVLQDVSPWIVYPKEVIFYTSNDGKSFTEAGRVQNKIEPAMDGAHMQTLGININLSARYLKIKAVNGGKLPSWHESAGNGSHLFIDEIIIQ